MSNKLSQQVLAAFAEQDPDAFGSIFVSKQGSSVLVSGTIHSSLPNVNDALSAIVLDLMPGSSPMTAVKNQRGKGLHVVVEEAEDRESAQTIDDEEPQLDRVKVLFQGDMPLSAIKHSHRYKRENWNTYRKVEAIVSVVGFTAPIVVNSNLEIIDGDMRFSIAQEHLKAKKFGPATPDTIPVIVIDDAGIKSDFLRLVLNRSTEFQRWLYPEVDAFVDSVPQAQPLLEPLGFFGERILPESFFGQTVLDYEIHEDFKSQQAFYKQEYGLAKWAEIQRDRIKAAEEAKKRSKAKKPTPGMVSLFDLAPKEEDFTPSYDIEAEKNEHVLAMRDVAGTITDNYDKKRRAEKEAKGQAWQTKRRSPKTVIKDLKAEQELGMDEDEFDEKLGEELGDATPEAAGEVQA